MKKNKCKFLFRRTFSLSIVFLSCLAFTGCRSVPDFEGAAGKEKNKEWTAECIASELTGNDPLEPFNRSMFICTRFCMRYIVRPIGYVYGSIMPKEAIKRIDYASDNLSSPTRMFGCLLQGQFTGSGVEFCRFLTNSTIGIAGFFDPAEAWFGLMRQNEDFGQAFGYWNIGPGCYLVLPFGVSGNVRDTVGGIFDKATDAKSYIPYVGYLASLNSIVNSYDLFNSMMETVYDPYDSAKVMLSLMRYANIENYHHKLVPPVSSEFGKAVIPEGPYQAEIVKAAHIYGAQNPLIDTLKSAFFRVQGNKDKWWVKTSFWNSDFTPKGVDASIKFSDGKKKNNTMPFQVWLQENDPDAPLVLLLPGATGHYRAEMLRALAEIYYDKGCSAVVLSSTLNPSFFLPAGMGLPGDVKTDTLYVRKTLKKVIDQLKKEFKLAPSKIIACGYSLGGLHTLHLAAMEEKAKARLPIDRYIAINPPADLFYALKKMDSMGAGVRQMNKKEFFDMASDTAMKIFLASSGKKEAMKLLHSLNTKGKTVSAPEKGKEQKQKTAGTKLPKVILPLSPEQAGWLSGIYMRMGLRELLFAAHQNAPKGEPLLKTPYRWGRRTLLYREIDSYSWYSYAEKLLLPYLKKKEKTLTIADLRKRAALRTIKSTLENNPKVRVLHNLDDPLLAPDDILFLDRALKKKLVWFDCGGHLGNMFLPMYREKLLEAAFDKKSVKKTK